jgi:hypothetical protein
VGGGRLVALAAGQEHDPGHRGRHVVAQRGHGALGDLLDARLGGGVAPGDDHVRLEQHAVQPHPVTVQGGEDLGQGVAGGHLAALDGVVAVHQHLGLDDRDQPGLLGAGGEAPEGLGVGPDAAGGGDAVPDGDDRPPLGEPGLKVPVGGQPVGQAVQALGDLLAREPGQSLGPGVDLDPGNDALAGQDLGQWGAVGGPLAQGLVIQNDAADELGRPLGGEQQLAVGAAVVLGALDLDGVEALLDGAAALVRGQDALARGDQRRRRRGQLVCRHLQPPRCDWGPTVSG